MNQLTNEVIQSVLPNADFPVHFEAQPFSFDHTLADHPLFSLDRLSRLAGEIEKKRPHDLYFDIGVVDVNQRWDDASVSKPSVQTAIENIHSSGAWIILKRAELDPEYAEIMNQCMKEAQSHVGRDFKADLKVAADSIIFITSPKRITTYHIDRECSFLLQIFGEKTINIFDRTDRQVLTEQELERFWSTDTNAPRYRPEFQDRASVFQLRPNNGVHIPVNCPHWLQNGDNVSISFNINCQFQDSLRANLYRANNVLRRIGVRPARPGENVAMDSFKTQSYGVYLNMKNGLRRAIGKPSPDFHV